MIRRLTESTRTDTLFAYTTRFRSIGIEVKDGAGGIHGVAVAVENARRPVVRFAEDRRISAVKQQMFHGAADFGETVAENLERDRVELGLDRKSTRLNSRH